MYDNLPRYGERKESLPCQTKKPGASSVVLLKRIRIISPSFTRSLLSRAARPSVPLANRPANIRRGIQVFTNVLIGTSGSKDSAAFLPLKESESFLLPSRQVNHELGSSKLSSSYSFQTLLQGLRGMCKDCRICRKKPAHVPGD